VTRVRQFTSHAESAGGGRFHALRAPCPAHRASRWQLPRHLPRSQRLHDLPGRRRSARLSGTRSDVRRAVPVDVARPLLDDDALPPRPAQHATRALARPSAPPGPLRAVVQRAPQALRASLRRQVLRARDRGRGLPARCVQLRRREPGPRGPRRGDRRLALGAQPLPQRIGTRADRNVRAQACGRRTSRPRRRTRLRARGHAVAPAPPRAPRRARNAVRGRSARVSPPGRPG
jgi:hypothetical protein